MTSGPTNHGGWGAPDPGGSGWGSPPGGTPDAPQAVPPVATNPWGGFPTGAPTNLPGPSGPSPDGGDPARKDGPEPGSGRSRTPLIIGIIIAAVAVTAVHGVAAYLFFGGSGDGDGGSGTAPAPRDDTATTTTAPDGPRETLQPDNV